MNINDILSLINAGFTKDDILSLINAGFTKDDIFSLTTEKLVEPAQLVEPVQPVEPAQPVESVQPVDSGAKTPAGVDERLDYIINRLNLMAVNTRNNPQPKTDDVDDILASIINPKTKKE